MNAGLLLERPQWAAARAPGGWTWVDASMAAVLTLVLVAEIVPNPEMTPHLWLLALSGLVTVPLAWRRAHAGWVAVTVSGGHAAMTAVATGPFSPQLSILPLLIALYSGGVGTRGFRAVLFGVVTLALTVLSWVMTEEGDGGDFWPWMLWAGAWMTGSFVRRRNDLAARHANRAAQLEIEARAAAAESAQRERDRIARELHDVVAHSVSVMVVQAGAERLRLGEDAGRTGNALTAIEEAGRAALSELRAMLDVMRDGSEEELAPLPGLSAIPALVERVRMTGLPVEITCRPAQLMDFGSGYDGVDATGLAAYRIVQEALTNVVRHAGRVPTRVELEANRTGLEVAVTNDPPHRAPPLVGRGSGRGIAGMRERAVALGGTLTNGVRPEGGYQVAAVLPFRSVPQEAR